jgi:hypothetical protein
MKLASLILPVRDNDGADQTDTHFALRATLVDTFGGYTVASATGAWRDDTGRVHHDESCVYSIAMDATPDNRVKLESIARFYGHMAGQICVMVTHAAGDVAIVTSRVAQLETA